MSVDAEEPIEEVAKRFNFWDKSLDSDPYPLLRRFREACPVAHSDELGGYWWATNFAGARRILTDPATFSSRTLVIPSPPPMIPESLDPPEHTMYRRVFTRYFSPRRVATMKESARMMAAELIAGFVAKGGGDFIADFAVPFPCLMFLDLAGLPAEDLEQLLEWKEMLLRDRLGDDEDKRRNVEEVVLPAILGYFDAALDARLSTDMGPDDLLTGLLNGELSEGVTMTRDEIHNALLLLLVAGLDTVTASIGLAIEYLASHDEDRNAIVADSSAIPTAVEEFLRYFSIVNVFREANVDVVVEGANIRKGEYVGLCFPAINRDEAQFMNAERVDIRRSPNPHLGFGAGPHRCLGSHLARMEMYVAFEEIHRQMPHYHVTAGTTPIHHFGGVTGIDELYLTVGRQL